MTEHDQWITVLQHQMVKTKSAPSGYDGNWPDKMGAVCRKDVAFEGMYEDCYICEFLVDGTTLRKPSARQWILACLREPVISDGSEAMGGPEKAGQVVGVRDKTREVKREVDGKTETFTEKAIVVLNLGYKNFGSALEGFAGYYGTLLDRDYIVKRQGATTDTLYQVIPNDPINARNSAGEVVRFDLREPEFAALYETDLDLEEIVVERSSDEFYARFFDPRISVSNEGKVEETGASPEPKPTNDLTQEALEAMAARVRQVQPQPVGELLNVE